MTESFTYAQLAEKSVRARLAKNGRNPANNNAGIPTGSDLHMLEIMVREIDKLRDLLKRARQQGEDRQAFTYQLLTEIDGALSHIPQMRQPE